MSKTIHRCNECNHPAHDHGAAFGDGHRPRTGPCSLGGCACRLTPTQVRDANPAVTIPTFPAYDAATDTWAPRTWPPTEAAS